MTSIDKFNILLDFVLENALGDEINYVTANILGKFVMGLLDSGATLKISGNKGVGLITEIGLSIDRSMSSCCVVAD